MPAAAQPLEAWLRPFAAPLGEATWRRALVLVAGALLAPGRRTVASALRAAGLGRAPGFANFHRVLSEGRWSGLALAERLLALLVAAFVPHGPVVVALDDTLERRWGRRIRARGIYRDPVRSSHGHFVKASGLRWLSLMLVVPVPWAGRAWALPFLTVLAPSEQSARERGGRHKRLTDWARQALLQAARWLPGRRVVAVADSGFAALELLDAVRHQGGYVAKLLGDGVLSYFGWPRAQKTYGPPRPQAAWRPGGERSAATYPAPGRSPLPRWRYARPGPHNDAGLWGRLLRQVAEPPVDRQAISPHHPQTSHGPRRRVRAADRSCSTRPRRAPARSRGRGAAPPRRRAPACWPAPPPPCSGASVPAARPATARAACRSRPAWTARRARRG